VRLVRPIRFVASVTQGVRHYSTRRVGKAAWKGRLRPYTRESQTGKLGLRRDRIQSPAATRVNQSFIRPLPPSLNLLPPFLKKRFNDFCPPGNRRSLRVNISSRVKRKRGSDTFKYPRVIQVITRVSSNERSRLSRSRRVLSRGTRRLLRIRGGMCREISSASSVNVGETSLCRARQRKFPNKIAPASL